MREQTTMNKVFKNVITIAIVINFIAWLALIITMILNILSEIKNGNSSYIILFVLFAMLSNSFMALNNTRRKKILLYYYCFIKNKGDILKMNNAFINDLIGKEVTISTLTQVSFGVIEEIQENWLKLSRTKKGIKAVEIINIEMISNLKVHK